MAESTPSATRGIKPVSTEGELEASRKLNPGQATGSGTPSPVTQAKDLIKSHFYHLKKFYGLTD